MVLRAYSKWRNIHPGKSIKTLRSQKKKKKKTCLTSEEHVAHAHTRAQHCRGVDSGHIHTSLHLETTDRHLFANDNVIISRNHNMTWWGREATAQWHITLTKFTNRGTKYFHACQLSWNDHLNSSCRPSPAAQVCLIRSQGSELVAKEASFLTIICCDKTAICPKHS